MNRKSKHFFLIASMIMILSLLLVACDGAATEAPEVEEPEIVGAYAIPWGFETLDPSASSEIEMVVLMNAYETLTYTPEYDTQLALPLLATSWESNEDGTEWVFHLREGVKFHDGSDFTAEAVKYSFERTVRIGVGASYLLDPIQEIIIIDDYTVQFNCLWPTPMDIIAASAYGVYIMNPRVAEETGDSEDWFNEGNDAGTGPYVIETYNVGERTLMKKFEDYWDGHKPRSFDRVIVSIIEDAVVLQQSLEAGESDIAWGVPTENRELLESNPDINATQEFTFIVHMIHINTQHPALDNKLVRQAMAYSFPYDDFINFGLGGLGEDAITLVPKGAWGYCDTCFKYDYDLDKARDLLTEAGYPDGGGLEFEAIVFTGSFVKEQALELWRGELAKLGIDLTITPMVGEAAYTLLRSSAEVAPDFLGFSWWQDIVHPSAFLTSSFACEEDIYFNFSYWCNEEFDQLLNDAWPISLSDQEEAIRLYDEAQKILIEEMPAIFLWQEVKNWYVHADVEGFVPNPAYTNTVFWKFLTRAE